MERVKPYYDQILTEQQAQATVQSRGQFFKYEGKGSVWQLPNNVWGRVDPDGWGQFRVRLYRTKDCPC